jgi:hypothetical protein
MSVSFCMNAVRRGGTQAVYLLAELPPV